MISLVVVAVIIAIVSFVQAWIDGSIRSSSYLIWLAIFVLLLSSMKLAL
jgi:hypothetical protein